MVDVKRGERNARWKPAIDSPGMLPCEPGALPFHTETLQLFVAHGSRPEAGASARAPQERRAAVAA